MAELYLTPEQVAERLQLHPETVRRQLKAGKLRGVRRGRVWRIPETALSESTSERTSAPRRKARSGGAAPDSTLAQADAIWKEMISGGARHNAAIIALARAPEAVRAIVMQRSGEVAARYYATPEGQQELADWRAIQGEPFYDDEGDGDDL